MLNQIKNIEYFSPK